MFDYRQISSDLIKDLPDRTKNVISRRFGLDGSLSGWTGKIKGESLESIGLDYGITRERVRQIEKDGLLKIGRRLSKHKDVISKLENKMAEFGGLKKEDLYIESVSEKEMSNHALLLLSVSDLFHRFPENKDFHSFWSVDKSQFERASDAVRSIRKILDEKREPLNVEHCVNFIPLTPPLKINSLLEISKHIHQNEDGMFGLKHWPEINPRSIKDKAYLAFKKHGKPLHFTEAASLMGKLTLPQTVHNELIKDPRFVLVGRGIYALKEWGYEPGEAKEVIKKILLSAGGPLGKREIIEEVLKRRIIKENTILQNLSNKKYFRRCPDGKYVLNLNH